MSSIPQFHVDSLLSRTSAKHDKIEISIGAWEIDLGSQGEAVLLIRGLGPPDSIYVDNRRSRLRHPGGEFGWIFNVLNVKQLSTDSKDEPADVWRRLRVRAQPLRLSGVADQVLPPIFAGYGEFQITQVGGRLPVKLRCGLNLSINPTRYLFHRASRRSVTRPVQEQDCWDRFPPPKGEFSFDGNDNWLPQHKWLQQSSKHWDIHLRRYLHGIENAFTKELDRVAPSPGLWTRVAARYNIKKAETYFEALSANPLAAVESLKPHIGSFSSMGGRGRLYGTTDEAVQERQSVLVVHSSQGESLKIYSKTNKRLRFEVVHTFTGDKRFQFPRRRVAQSSAHTFDNIDDVVGFLSRLSDRSTDVANDFLKHVRKQRHVPLFSRTVYSTLLHIRYCLPENFEIADLIMAMLVHQHSVSIPKHASSEFRYGVKSLLRGGVIERSGRHSNYIVSSGYRAAFVLLRENQGFFDLQPPVESPKIDV